jgi:MFS family permease
MYRIYSDAQLVSEAYFIIGLLSFLVTLIVPWISRKIPRRWLYSIGVTTYILSALICAWSNSWMFSFGLGLFTIANVVVFVCSNAYVMDYINRVKLAECEALRLFYSGAAWTIGPFLGNCTTQSICLPESISAPTPAGRRMDICRDEVQRLVGIHSLPPHLRRGKRP